MLRFESSPDFESGSRMDLTASPTPTIVTIEASDGGQGTTAMEECDHYEITNVDEPGTVTLSTLQPQVGREITATLDDPDNQIVSTITWQWYRGSSSITGETNGAGFITSAYNPKLPVM